MDVFGEVAILERCAGDPSVCRLLDYGLEGDAAVLVLQRYPASLKAWRAQLPGPPGPGQLRLFLRIFADVVAAVQVALALYPRPSAPISSVLAQQQSCRHSPEAVTCPPMPPH